MTRARGSWKICAAILGLGACIDPLPEMGGPPMARDGQPPSADAGDARVGPPVADLGPGLADLGLPPADAAPGADAALDGTASDMAPAEDAHLLDAHPDPDDLGPDDAPDDLGPDDAPDDLGPDDAPDDLGPDQSPADPLARPADDHYVLHGACALDVPPVRGLLANDDAPAGAEVVPDLPLPEAVDVLADGSLRATPGGAIDLWFTYRLRLPDGRLTEPAHVTLRQRPDAVVVDQPDDAWPAVGCTLRAALLSLALGQPLGGCALPPEARHVVFAHEVVTLTLDPARALTDLDREADLDVVGEVTLHGCGVEQTIVDGGGETRAFDVAPTGHLTARRMTIRRGRATQGGGLRVAGRLDLEDVALRENVAEGPPGLEGAPGSGGGGGGGAGLGGALLLDRGAQVTIRAGEASTCALSANRAVGGRGGDGGALAGQTAGVGGRGGGPLGGFGGQVGALAPLRSGLPGGLYSGGGGGAGHSADGGAAGSGGPFGGGGGGGGRTGGNGDGAQGASGGFLGGAGGRNRCNHGGPGGGGAGLGGAIHNEWGHLTVGLDCHLADNTVAGGLPGEQEACGNATAAVGGAGRGADVFTRGPAEGTVLEAPVLHELCAQIANCPNQ